MHDIPLIRYHNKQEAVDGWEWSFESFREVNVKVTLTLEKLEVLCNIYWIFSPFFFFNFSIAPQAIYKHIE